MKRAGLRAMRAAAAPGECPMCGDELAKKRSGGRVTDKPRTTCGDPICLAAWINAWKRDARADRAASPDCFFCGMPKAMCKSPKRKHLRAGTCGAAECEAKHKLYNKRLTIPAGPNTERKTR